VKHADTPCMDTALQLQLQHTASDSMPGTISTTQPAHVRFLATLLDPPHPDMLALHVNPACMLPLLGNYSRQQHTSADIWHVCESHAKAVQKPHQSAPLT
jgi:hypothetical protein